jgi:hypothetical protein
VVYDPNRRATRIRRDEGRGSLGNAYSSWIQGEDYGGGLGQVLRHEGVQVWLLNMAEWERERLRRVIGSEDG